MPEPSISQFINALKPGQFFEALFDTVEGSYYFVKDLNGAFITANTGFLAIMGAKSLDEVIGKTDFDLSPSFLAESFQKDDQQVIETQEALYNKVELVPTKEGTLDWLCTTKIPLFDHDDNVVGIAGVTRLILDSDNLYADQPEMKVIVNYLRDNYANKITMPEVAKIAKISVSTQERLFKKTFGITPLMYLQKIRLGAACSLLRNTKTEIPKIAVKTGFNDHTNMTRAFRLELKITPLKYRKNYSKG